MGEETMKALETTAIHLEERRDAAQLAADRLREQADEKSARADKLDLDPNRFKMLAAKLRREATLAYASADVAAANATEYTGAMNLLRSIVTQAQEMGLVWPSK